MNTISGMIFAVIAIWFAGLGVSVMMGKEKPYVAWSRRLFVKPIGRRLRRHKPKIIWMIIGAIICFIVIKGFYQPPT